MNETVLDCELLLTAPGEQPPLLNRRLTIAGGQITEIAPRPEDDPSAATIRVITPGLVNNHQHLAYEPLPGQQPADPVSWLKAVTTQSRQQSLATQLAITERNCQLTRQCGISTVIENNFLPALAPVVAESGLNAIFGLEVFGVNAPSASQKVRRYLETLQQLRSDPKSSRLHYVLAPHSIYNLSTPMLQALAEQTDGPLLMHLAEFDFEAELTQNGERPAALSAFHEQLRLVVSDRDFWTAGRGLSPVGYLAQLGLLSERLLLTHLVTADQQDLVALASAAVPVVSCPVSNQRLCRRLAPLPLMHQHGLDVCFGTDGLGSSDDFDLLAALRLVHRQYPALPLSWLWSGVTGRAGRIWAQLAGQQGSPPGQLSTGSAADLCCWQLSGPAAAGLRDLLSAQDQNQQWQEELLGYLLTELTAREHLISLWLKGQA